MKEELTQKIDQALEAVDYAIEHRDGQLNVNLLFPIKSSLLHLKQGRVTVDMIASFRSLINRSFEDSDPSRSIFQIKVPVGEETPILRAVLDELEDNLISIRRESFGY